MCDFFFGSSGKDRVALKEPGANRTEQTRPREGALAHATMSQIVEFGDGGRRRPTGPVLAPICAKAGPLSPVHSKILPPGFGRTTAGIAFTVTLQAFDAYDTKIYEGGARVKARARRVFQEDEPEAGAGGPEPLVEGNVADNGDGTYAITLSLPRGGEYQVAVEMNSAHVEGSPFSVVAFSLSGGNVPRPAGPPRPQVAPPPPAASAPPPPEDPPLPTADFDPSDLSTVVNVGNISAKLPLAELRKIFAQCGEVLDCRNVGSDQFALVRFSTRDEAQRAAAMLNGMEAGDRALRVTLAEAAQGGAGGTAQGVVGGDAIGDAIREAKRRRLQAATEPRLAPLEIAKARAAAITQRLLGAPRGAA